MVVCICCAGAGLCEPGAAGKGTADCDGDKQGQAGADLQSQHREKKLAISFDATWGTELTDELLAILDEHGITTTFFLAGYWVDKHPDYVVKIAAAGHEIGNHSYSHPHMNTLSEQGIAYELQKNADLIRDLTGQRTTLFRPPFGEYNNQVISVAPNLGYHTIQWSVDSLDWKNLTSSQIYDRAMDQVEPGSIVLFTTPPQEPLGLFAV